MNNKNSKVFSNNHEENEDKAIDKISNKNNNSKIENYGEQGTNNEKESQENHNKCRKTVLSETGLIYNTNNPAIFQKSEEMQSTFDTQTKKRRMYSSDSISLQLESETNNVSRAINNDFLTVPLHSAVKKQSYELQSNSGIQIRKSEIDNVSTATIIKKNDSFTPLFSDTSSLTKLSEIAKCLNEQTLLKSTSSLKSVPTTLSVNEKLKSILLSIRSQCQQQNCSTQTNLNLPLTLSEFTPRNLDSSLLVSEPNTSRIILESFLLNPQRPQPSCSTQTNPYQPQYPISSSAFTPRNLDSSLLASEPNTSGIISKSLSLNPQRPQPSCNTQTNPYQPQYPTSSSAFTPRNLDSSLLASEPNTSGIISKSLSLNPQRPQPSCNTQTNPYQPQYPTSSSAFTPRNLDSSLLASEPNTSGIISKSLSLNPQRPQPSCSTQTNPYQPQYPASSAFTPRNIDSSLLVSERNTSGINFSDSQKNHLKNKYRASLSTKDSKPRGRNKCQYCDTFFKSYKALVQHIDKIHYTTCPICNSSMLHPLLPNHYLENHAVNYSSSDENK